MPDVRLSCRLLSLLAGVFLAGCAVGPDYQRPAQDVGVAYAHAPAGQWRPAEPGIVRLKSAWWQGFNDPQLDELMRRLSAQNLDLVQAEAQYRQAQAALDGRANLAPLARRVFMHCSISSTLKLERPTNRTLPSFTISSSAPIVSSNGVFRSGQCTMYTST